MMWFVQYRLAAQLNAHLVCTLHNFRFHENKYTRHTSAPNTSIKERVPRWLYVETRNDVEIFYQSVLRDGLNLR